MNKLLYIILLVTVIFSCQNNNKPENSNKNPENITNVSFKPKHITSPYNGSEFTVGDTLYINTKGGDANIDSVITDINGVKQETYKANDSIFTIYTSKLNVGKHFVNIQSFKNGKRKQDNITIFLKSDIKPKNVKATVIKKYPHSTTSYTQGLTFDNGNLYEGTGQWGQSALMKIDLETGKPEKLYNLPSKVFGEGIVVYKNEIIQLTWTSRKAFVFNKNTFELKNTFSYDTQGWGITNYNNNLIMSDGTNVLYILEPNTFTVIKQIEVYDDAKAVTNLNELEYINGKIFANVYLTNIIVIINPETGKVEGKIDLTQITPKKYREEHDLVLNGIAYNKQNGKLYITGKQWDVLFEIKIDY